MTYTSIRDQRRSFMEEYKKEDHIVLPGNNKVVLSAPHGVSQVRLGRHKGKEIGSVNMVLAVQQLTHSFAILKTCNNHDDANFDEYSPYKNALNEIVEKEKIQYVIDFHGLASKRPIDVNLGVNLGHNIDTNPSLIDPLIQQLTKHGFIVSIDQPFVGGGNTIAGSVKRRYPGVWAMQVEVNCAITNQRKNAKRFEQLVDIITTWIKGLQ